MSEQTDHLFGTRCLKCGQRHLVETACPISFIASQPAPVVAEVRRAPLDLESAANERDAIETLLSDRSEPGTYAKVEGLLSDLESLRGRLRGLEREMALSNAPAAKYWRKRLAALLTPLEAK